MDLGIAGKRALVTGASRGLGLAVARALAEEGVRTALCARNRETLTDAAAEIAAATGHKAVAVVGDLTEPGQPARVVEKTADALGGLDILVTNAGGPPAGSFFDFDDDDWLDAFRLNCLSALGLIKAAVPLMQINGWGRIVNLTSISVKQPLPPLILSNAVRAGLTGAAKTLSQDLAPEGITVNNVATGWTRTERVTELLAHKARKTGRPLEEVEAEAIAQIPLGRMNTPREVADVVVFLASDPARAVTGTTTAVDGGFCGGLL